MIFILYYTFLYHIIFFIVTMGGREGVIFIFPAQRSMGKALRGEECKGFTKQVLFIWSLEHRWASDL